MEGNTEYRDEQMEVDNTNMKDVIARYFSGELTFSAYATYVAEADTKDSETDLPDDTGPARNVPSVDDHDMPGPSTSIHCEAFRQELEGASTLRKHQSRAQRRQTKLTVSQRNLMGQANIFYSNGKHAEAIDFCKEIIRQNPFAAEPFTTLATIYEELNDTEKALACALTAAYLGRNNADDWVSLAEQLMGVKNYEQALMCYGKAISAAPTNLDHHMARCELYNHVGDKKNALRGYLRVIQLIGNDEGKLYLKVAKLVAKLYHEFNDIPKARETMQKAFELHQDCITSEDVNLMLELLISESKYDISLQLLVNHCGISFDGANIADKSTALEIAQSAETCVTPHELAIDLRTKLTITLIHLGLTKFVKEIQIPILEEDPEDLGDLYLDVAEAYMANSQWKDALPLLEPLIRSKTYSLAAVWLKYGEALYGSGELQRSAEAYSNVIQLAPAHSEFRITLSSILRKLNRSEEAIKVLTQDDEEEMMDPQLLFERCQIFLAENRMEEFLEAGKRYFAFEPIRDRAELETIARTRKSNRFLRRKKRPEGTDDETYAPPKSTIPEEDEWELYITMCNKLYELERFPELERLTFECMASAKFSDDRLKELEFLCLLSCYYNNDMSVAYNFVRDYVTHNPDNNQVWNMFNLILQGVEDIRHNRFLLRQMMHQPDSLPLQILNAHNCLAAGTYKYALTEYMAAFKQAPDEPLLALMIGICILHMACQKFSAKKHSLVAQAVGFFNKYAELRGECQETYYNLGRAMHQLSIFSAAIFYYEKVFALPPVIEDPEGKYDFKRDAAFNMHLICRASNNDVMAASYLQKYCVI